MYIVVYNMELADENLEMNFSSSPLSIKIKILEKSYGDRKLFALI